MSEFHGFDDDVEVQSVEVPNVEVPSTLRNAVEVQLDCVDFTQRDVMKAVDTYVRSAIVVTSAELLSGRHLTVAWAMQAAEARLLPYQARTLDEDMIMLVSSDVATRRQVEKQYTHLKELMVEQPDQKPGPVHMDLPPLPDAEFPARHSRIRKEAVVLAVLIGLICLMGVITAVMSNHPRPALSPAEAVAQQATLRKALAPPAPQPDPSAWDEDRDGNGALEIEDTNGQGTLYVDGPTKTRVLCVSGSSCIVLPNPKPASPVVAMGKTSSKP